MSHCPICQETRFDEFGGRSNARCTNCGSLERGRLAWMVLEKLGLLKPGIKLLNVAPEPFMLSYCGKRIGDGYDARDFDPGRFAKWPVHVGYVDLCDQKTLPAATYDVVVHNHVLEHVPCSVELALRNVQHTLVTGGYQIFSVPIRPNSQTVEDTSPGLTGEQRQKLFGQHDHMRIFGSDDIIDIISRAGLTEVLELSDILSEPDLAAHNVPVTSLRTLDSHHVFAARKTS